MSYEWRWGMDEVSGFGGTYEAAMRAMIRAGLQWLDAHPLADPRYDDGMAANEDAEELRQAMLEARIEPGGMTVGRLGPTGAMYRAALNHVLWIRRHGWRRYVWAMRWRRVRSAWRELGWRLSAAVRG